MTDQLWILVIMAGVAALLTLIALIMFTPPRPAVPNEGAVHISLSPFKDLEPDPANADLGDRIARIFAATLDRYDRVETVIGDEPGRFLVKGEVRKNGPRLAVRIAVASDRRHFWSRAFDVKETDTDAAIAKAANALARQMKLALK